MKALKLLFLLPLSILSLEMSAQIDDLLRNRDITWVAETYNDFLTEQAYKEEIGKEISRVIPLKFLNKNEAIMSETALLQNIIIYAILRGRMQCYKDMDCKIQNINWQPSSIDTILQIDPTTFEEKVKVVYSKF